MRAEVGIRLSFAARQHAEICRRQIRWLGLNGLQHNLAQLPEFAEMCQLYDPQFKHVARLTYINSVAAMFQKMISGIKDLSNDCRRDLGAIENLLSISHDI